MACFLWTNSWYHGPGPRGGGEAVTSSNIFQGKNVGCVCLSSSIAVLKWLCSSLGHQGFRPVFLFDTCRSWMMLLPVYATPSSPGWWGPPRCWGWLQWCWPGCGWVITVEALPGMALARSSMFILCAWCWAWSSCMATVSPCWSLTMTVQFCSILSDGTTGLPFWNQFS